MIIRYILFKLKMFNLENFLYCNIFSIVFMYSLRLKSNEKKKFPVHETWYFKHIWR